MEFMRKLWDIIHSKCHTLSTQSNSDVFSNTLSASLISFLSRALPYEVLFRETLLRKRVIRSLSESWICRSNETGNHVCHMEEAILDSAVNCSGTCWNLQSLRKLWGNFRNNVRSTLWKIYLWLGMSYRTCSEDCNYYLFFLGGVPLCWMI